MTAATSVNSGVPVRPVVLVVDDVPLNRLVLARMLSRLGYDVLQAHDGQECLRICHSAAHGSIACVLLDLNMPILDGWGTALQLRNWEKHEAGAGRSALPLVACTNEVLSSIAPNSEAEVTVAQHAISCGIDECISKPPRLEDLQAVLSKYMASSAPMLAPTPTSPSSFSSCCPGSTRCDSEDDTAAAFSAVTDAVCDSETTVMDEDDQGSEELQDMCCAPSMQGRAGLAATLSLHDPPSRAASLPLALELTLPIPLPLPHARPTSMQSSRALRAFTSTGIAVEVGAQRQGEAAAPSGNGTISESDAWREQRKRNTMPGICYSGSLPVPRAIIPATSPSLLCNGVTLRLAAMQGGALPALPHAHAHQSDPGTQSLSRMLEQREQLQELQQQERRHHQQQARQWHRTACCAGSEQQPMDAGGGVRGEVDASMHRPAAFGSKSCGGTECRDSGEFKRKSYRRRQSDLGELFWLECVVAAGNVLAAPSVPPTSTQSCLPSHHSRHHHHHHSSQGQQQGGQPQARSHGNALHHFQQSDPSDPVTHLPHDGMEAFPDAAAAAAATGDADAAFGDQAPALSRKRTLS